MGWKLRARYALLAVPCLYIFTGCGANSVGGVPTVGITPFSAQVDPGGKVEFRAVFENLNGGVSWSVADANSGSITADGTYTAPSDPGLYAVYARSITDPDRTCHAVVVVGDYPEAIDRTFDFTASPVQPGVMTISSTTGCIRGKLRGEDGQLLEGVALHLYRLTEAAGRAYQAGEDVDLSLPSRAAGASRQASADGLETYRATTVSRGYGYYHEPTNNFTFGTTPNGYYLLTFDLTLPDGRQGEGVAGVMQVTLNGDIFADVFVSTFLTPPKAYAMLPGQTKTLPYSALTYYIGRLDSTQSLGFYAKQLKMTPVAGAGSVDAGAFTAGPELGIWVIAAGDVSNIPAYASPLVRFSRMHVVGLRTLLAPATMQFEGGQVELWVAAVRGTGTQPDMVDAVVTGPNGYSQAFPLTESDLGSSAFDSASFAYPEDWVFKTGSFTLPANLTTSAQTYTVTVRAPYGALGDVTQTSTIDVPGINQPAEPPMVRSR